MKVESSDGATWYKDTLDIYMLFQLFVQSLNYWNYRDESALVPCIWLI